ncbi:MAG TPA: CAP domain-containing protein [Gaiellaceae bacterium]|nr:CAP domain-containing protein [Gaiellaceae bacterium]
MLSLARKTVAAALAAAALLALPAVAGASSMTSSEASLLREINRVRIAHGVPALHFDARLARAARAHSEDMARKGYFAHGSFAGRMLHFGVHGPFVGENLAWGTGSFGTAPGIVSAWLRSPEHRANLLRPGFRRIGLGELNATFEGTAGANVVTADFAGF